MKTTKVISKGYTLDVESWENDGDYVYTKQIIVKSKDRAKILHKMCKELFCCSNSEEGGIGNLLKEHLIKGDITKAEENIMDFFEENKQEMILSWPGLKGADKDRVYDYVMDIAYDLMGSSETYICRVCEKVSVTYSKEDVFLQEVSF